MKSYAQMLADFLRASAGGATSTEVAMLPERFAHEGLHGIARKLQRAGYEYLSDVQLSTQWPPFSADQQSDLLSMVKKRRAIVFDATIPGQVLISPRAIVVATNDSPDKVLRKMAAAEVVEERLQEEANQFQAWTGQPPRLGIPGETLLSGLADAGIKYGGFVLTGIVSREVVTALIRERAYPMDDIQRVLADSTFGYETHVNSLVKDKSRPVVVLGMTLDASMFVVVSTWDSPEKVARKLQAALSVRESKLTEGWQVMPHRPSLTEQSTKEWYDLELRLKRNGIRSVGYVHVADYAALDIDYRRQLVEVYGQRNVQEVSDPFRLNIRPDQVGKGGIVVYSWVTAGSRILVVTDDSPEKLVRKMVVHGATKSDLEEGWTASPTVNLSSGAQHSELEAGVLLLKGLGATVTGYAKSDTCTLGDLMALAADEFGAENVAVIPGYSMPRHVEFLARVRGKNVVITLSRANWPVAVVTDDSPEKVVRRLTRGETTQESMINEDRGGPLVISREFPEESPMYRIAENMERHGTKVNGIISNFWGSEAYNAALRAGYEASWTMSFKNSDGALDINGRLVEQCVLVLGSLVTSSIAVCIHTDDSPEKVLRKLEAARFNTESLARNLIREATE